jgi:hypothetical protein
MEAVKVLDLPTLVPFALGCAIGLAALLLAAIGVVLVVGLEQLQERRGMAEMGG